MIEKTTSVVSAHTRLPDVGPAEFLTSLYGRDAPGYIAIWTRQDGQTDWFPANNLSLVSETAAAVAARYDVYFGIGLHPEPLGPRKRGSATGVIAIPGLWIDLDFAGPAHKGANLPPDEDAAWNLVNEFPLQPTIVVHSGHGLQAWWLFNELWIFSDERERREAQHLVRRFQGRVGQMAAGHGWTTDNTSDLARVLRLPGTVNRKLEPVPVHVIWRAE